MPNRSAIWFKTSGFTAIEPYFRKWFF